MSTSCAIRWSPASSAPMKRRRPCRTKASCRTAEAGYLMSELDIQISIEAGAWPSEQRLFETSGRVLGAAAGYVRKQETQPFPKTGAPEVSLVFTNDESIRTINAEWRSQNKPTNVLSFPAFPVTP